MSVVNNNNNQICKVAWAKLQRGWRIFAVLSACHDRHDHLSITVTEPLHSDNCVSLVREPDHCSSLTSQTSNHSHCMRYHSTLVTTCQSRQNAVSQ